MSRNPLRVLDPEFWDRIASNQLLLDRLLARLLDLAPRAYSTLAEDEIPDSLEVLLSLLLLLSGRDVYKVARKVARRWVREKRDTIAVYLGIDELSPPIFRQRRVSADNRDGTLRIHFLDYMESMRWIWDYDQRWKLVNTFLNNGFVIIPKEEVDDFLIALVTARLVELSSRMKKEEREAVLIPEDLRELASSWRRAFKHSVPLKREEKPVVVETHSVFPPCMRDLMERLKRGEEIPHIARFTLTAFLLHIGWSIDEIVSLFTKVSDFDERMTRYQVEHIAGLRGSRTKYKPLSCKNMKFYGLCTGDKYCRGISHPLQYYEKWRK